MARSLKPIPLPSLRGGINRFDSSARPDQIVDGLDVIADTGELRRRDAYTAISAVCPHILPEGSTRVVTESGSGTLTSYTNRLAVLSPNITIVYVGQASEPFNAISWPYAEHTETGVSASSTIALDYWNGSAWTALSHFLDTTGRFASTDYWRPLWQIGQLTFHLPSSWATTTVNSLTAYWIRIRHLSNAGAALAIAPAADAFELVEPGIRVGNTQAVRGLWPVTVGNSLQLVCAHDRIPRRGMEAGAALSTWEMNPTERMMPLDVVHNEGAGYINAMTWPTWTGGGGGTTIGTAGYLTDFNSTVDIAAAALIGAPVFDQMVPSVGATTTSATFVALIDSGVSDFANQWEDFFIHCVANGSAAGTPTGQVRKIVTSTTTASNGVVTVYDAWSIAPDVDNRFRIERVPTRVRTKQVALDSGLRRDTFYPVYAHTSNTMPAGLNLQAGIGLRTFDYDISGTLEDNILNWALEWDIRWRIRSSERWTAGYDPLSKRLLLTNGVSGVLAYDGARLREEIADTTSENAGALTASLPDTPEEAYNTAPRAIRDALLYARPPCGRLLVNYRNRFISAGFVDEPFHIRYSYFGTLNNIWPKTYEAIIADGPNRPITGMATLNDQLVIFTEASIHIADVGESGHLLPRPAAQGIGFSSHQAVVPIVFNGVSNLVGVASDGIYAFGGGEPSAVLQDWSQVLDGGVNVGGLGRSVAAVWRQKNLAFFAVPAAGSSTNNRVVVMDYSGEAPTWWVWSAPFGISSMASVIQPGGEEMLLIGTDDGFIQTLRDAPTDDGTAISAYARSVTIQPSEADVRPTRLNLTVRGLGSTETMNIAIYEGRRDVASASGAYPVASGGSTYGVAVYNTSTFTDERYRTFHIGIPSGIRNSMLQIQLGGSTRWAYKSASLELRPMTTGLRGP